MFQKKKFLAFLLFTVGMLTACGSHQGMENSNTKEDKASQDEYIEVNMSLDDLKEELQHSLKG